MGAKASENISSRKRLTLISCLFLYQMIMISVLSYPIVLDEKLVGNWYNFVLNRYAAAPHEVRTDWDKFTKDYFLNRPTLVSVFLLIDASIPAKKIDLEYASWLGQNQVSKSISKAPSQYYA